MKEINIYDLKLNFNDFIRGFLVTSGNLESHNMLTAGWGNIGAFWSRPTMTVYIRKSRYTYQFIDNEEYFSCCFFDHKVHANVLDVCGKESGRDVDKTKKCDLHPIELYNTVAFKEANLVIICRKIHHFDILEADFDDKNLGGKAYSDHDFHRGYIGEIVKAYVND